MDAPTTQVELSSDEVERLLDLIGHDAATADEWEMVSLVRSLYRQRHAFADAHPPATLFLELSRRQLDLLHRYFTPAAFGPGGREFRLKLSRAFVEMERLEDIPEIEEEPTVELDETFGEEERRRLAAWKDQLGDSAGPENEEAGPEGRRHHDG